MMKKGNNILSKDYIKLVVEDENKKILAEITCDEVKTANNIIVKLTPNTNV